MVCLYWIKLKKNNFFFFLSFLFFSTTPHLPQPRLLPPSRFPATSQLRGSLSSSSSRKTRSPPRHLRTCSTKKDKNSKVQLWEWEPPCSATPVSTKSTTVAAAIASITPPSLGTRWPTSQLRKFPFPSLKTPKFWSHWNLRTKIDQKTQKFLK